MKIDTTINIDTIVDIASAVISLISVIITCYLSYQTIKIQKQQNEDEKQKQIKQIHLYLDINQSEDNLKITNNSDFPIFDMYIFSIKNNIIQKNEDINSLITGQFNIQLIKRYYTISANTSINLKKIETQGRGCGQFPIALAIFKDVNNQCWVTTQEGIKQKINDNEKQSFLINNQILEPIPGSFE